MLHVISTAFTSPFERKCRESVAMQVGVEFEHTYIDASKQREPKSAMSNLRIAVAGLPDDTIVAHVDGDDWLTIGTALKRAQAEHDAGAWVTYGSFMFADGRPGFCAPYEPGENVRTSRWRASHLKTFRAGLFNRIAPEDLSLEHARDLAVMMPLLEMAGPRARFIPDVLYVYNLAASFEWSATEEQLSEERRCVAEIRGRKPYARVETL